MFIKKIEIPKEVEVDIEYLGKLDGYQVRVKGPKGVLVRKFNFPYVKIEKQNNYVIISSEKEKRKYKAIVGTYKAHIQNMFRGVLEGFTYRLKIFYRHFPIQVKLEGDKFYIINFLGEKAPRIVEIPEGVEVRIKGDEIEVFSIDIEKAGRTAASIETATRIKRLDKRKFIDGIYIIEKPTSRFV